MPELVCPEIAEFLPRNKVLNWEAAKLLGFAGPSDPRLASAAKANSNKSFEITESFEILRTFRTVESGRKSLRHDFPTSSQFGRPGRCWRPRRMEAQRRLHHVLHHAAQYVVIDSAFRCDLWDLK